MTYRWIEDIREFKDIAKDWDDALIASGSGNPFLLSDFIITWWKHFYRGSALRIFFVHNGNKIAGGIPLCIKRGGPRYGFARMLSHIGGSAANYTEPLYSSLDAPVVSLLREALSQRRDWDVFYLSDVRPESKVLQESISSSGDKRFLFYLVQDHMNLAIDLSGGLDNYLASISKKLLKDLRAKRKRAVNEYGEIKLQEIKGQEEVNRYFDKFVEFSLHSFSKREKKSNFQDKRYADFFRESLVIMDRNARLDAHILVAGDNILAISFGYRFGRGFNWVWTGFNYEYKYLRPGYLLIEEIIKEIVSRGETHYNWYGYGRFYKSQWCNEETPLYRLFLMRRTLKGRLYKALFRMETILRAKW